MTGFESIPASDLRARLITHLRTSEGSDLSWAADALKVSYIDVEDALDAMVDEGLAFKDGSYDPPLYYLKGGSSD
ncbi:MAG: hypothetical protein P4L36_10820 [Holophaga sp.]|nr:hypothetical protein [Holophaga sp.]